MRISDCEVILKHILGNCINLSKKFYSFFHPQHSEGWISNPYQQVVEKEEGLKLIGADFYERSRRIWRNGKNYVKNNKPLYLLWIFVAFILLISERNEEIFHLYLNKCMKFDRLNFWIGVGYFEHSYWDISGRRNIWWYAFSMKLLNNSCLNWKLINCWWRV